MKHRYSIALLLILSGLMILAKVTLSQAPPGLFQQGSPVCNVFEQGGSQCARVGCSPISHHINTVCSTPEAQRSSLLCESSVPSDKILT